MAAPTLGENWQARLLGLPINWDGDGAGRISETAVRTIERISVVPCSGGGVQLEIHKDGIDLEVEVNKDGRITSALLIVDRE